jgi:hypothetical protein
VNGDEIQKAGNQMIGAGCALMILVPVAFLVLFLIVGLIESLVS